VIRDLDCSAELIDDKLSTKVSDRFDSKSLVGMECPGEILYSIGVDPASHVYTNIKKNVNLSLPLNDPPFEDIKDGIFELFKVSPHISLLDSNISLPFELRPLVMIFAPPPIRFDRIDVVDNSLKVQTILSNDANPNDVKVSLIGKYEDSTSIRKLISFYNIETRNGIPILSSLEIGEGQAQLKLRLFYKQVQVDYHEVNRKGPSFQKPV